MTTIPQAALGLGSLLMLGVALFVTLRSRPSEQRGQCQSPHPWLFAWATVAVFARASLFYGEIGLSDQAWRLVALDVLAAAMMAALFWLVPERLRPWALVFGVAGFSLLVWAHLLHWRFFGDVLSAGSISAAGQLGHLGESVRSLSQPSDLWLAWDVCGALVVCALIARGGPWSSGWSRVGRIAFAGGLLSLVGTSWWLASAAEGVKAFRRVDLVAERGLVHQHLGELVQPLLQRWRREVGTVDLERIESWYARSARHRQSLSESRTMTREGTKPWNVVLLQVESLQDFALEWTVGDPAEPVMPNLRRRQKQAFRLRNAFDPTGIGRTSDAEMAALASVLPVSESPAAFRFGGNRFVTLASVLAAGGYNAISAVPFEPSFWNRTTIHRSYGFERSLFADDFAAEGEVVGWGLNDRSFLRQALVQLEEMPEPFVALLVTLSLHTPYDEFPDALRTLPAFDFDTTKGFADADSVPEARVDHRTTALGNYLEAMRFFDRALEDFLLGLEARGLAKRTLVVVYGDHDAGLFRDPHLQRILNLRGRDHRRRAHDRLPLLFFVPGADRWGGWVGESEGLATLLDIAPTTLGLLGRSSDALPWQGRNLHYLVSSEPEVLSAGPVPLGTAGDWISDRLLYLSKGYGPYRGACFRRASLRQTPRKEPCVEDARLIDQQLQVAADVLAADLQHSLRFDSAASASGTGSP